MKLKIKKISTALLIVISSIVSGYAEEIGNLTVEYRQHPLGIDVDTPRFGWQMENTPGERGARQSAYQIVVENPHGETMWNTGEVDSDIALAIEYQGQPLQPATKYSWTVTVWDQDGESESATSWFETGLMNPDISAWDGATWIGGGDDDLTFYSHYEPIFDVSYALQIEEGSSKASFVMAANDLRLMDRNKNILQVENGINESYVEVELDLSGLEEQQNGTAKLNVYRVGYAPDDSADEPLQSFKIKNSLINNNNKNEVHEIAVGCVFGRYSFVLDGEQDFIVEEETDEEEEDRRGVSGASVSINPYGGGGNNIPFGMLCDIGFSLEPGQQAIFSDIVVTNNRMPNNTLFEENLSSDDYSGIYSKYNADSNSGMEITNRGYSLDGGSDGLFIVADPSRNSTPMLRTEFTANNQNISDARLYVTARGIYEVMINGDKVGNDYYNPGQTQYNKSHFYQVYDVTEMVHNGENAIGAMMSEGWWSGLLSYGSIWNHFGDRQSVLAKLVITYDDGTDDIIVTNDQDWKFYNEGPILYSSLDLGEVYDATRETAIDGWALPGYDDSSWENAVEVELEGTAYMGITTNRDGSQTDFNYESLSLIGQIGNNASVFDELVAQSMEEVREGVFVYNMGQNFVGVPRITIPDGTAGDTMILRVAEMLYPDLPESGENVGMIMTENYRAALSQDIYIMKDGPQVFQPKFTSHGYQYIEITGIDEPLPLENVEGIAISSVTSLTADFETSNEDVNQLWSNLVWSNVDNFLTLPTDCPQRNERMGWSGDISVFSRTATYVSNTDQFLRRHMFAMRDVQSEAGRFTDIAPVGGGFGGVLWGSAGLTVPWEVYQQYDDEALLEEHYEAMADYIDFLETTIDEETGLSSDNTLGDWLGPQNNQLGTDFLVTAYHVYDLYIMMRSAEVLGKDSDAEMYRQMYNERKEFFNDTFVNEDHKTVALVGAGRGFPADAVPEWKVADTQTSYAVGLALGAFSDENIPYMVENLAESVRRQNLDDEGVLRPEYSLMTGFIGTAWISKALSDYGHSDLAYRLLQNNQYPSWLYPIEQGATTIWERLNGYTVEDGFGGNNGMNSFNHYSFGAVGQWMMAYSLGIQRNQPGFKNFILQPEPDPTGEMTWAEGYYDSMYGRIESSWEKNNAGVTYSFTVPANTTATLYLPSSSDATILESGDSADDSEGVEFVNYEAGKMVYELQAGEYEFEVN